MRQLLVLAILILATGCATGSSKGNSSGTQNPLFSGKAVREAPAESDALADENDGGQSTPTDSGPKNDLPIAESASSDQYSALADALRSQSESRIQSVVSQILGKNSKDEKALNALGVHYYRTGRPEMARLIWGRALKDHPGSASLLNNLGLLFLKDDKPELAIREFRKALSQNGSLSAASANLGALHVKYLNYEAAKTYLAQAYQDRQKDLSVAVNYAIALRGLGQLEDSRKIYEAINAEKSDQTLVLLNYAILLIEYLSEKQKGLEIVNKVRYYHSDPDIIKKANQLAERAQNLN